MKISVIIPTYNEEENIKKVVHSVDQIKLNKEIIVVDDGSSDSTWKRVLELKLPNLITVRHDKNQGKGAAIRTGVRKASGDIVLIQDADFEYNPEDYYALVKPIQNGTAAVVYGSRFKGTMVGMTVPNLLANKILTAVANLLYGTKLTDEATCYKVFRYDILKKQKLRCHRFDFCPEITAKISKNGIKIQEVPISYNARTIKQGKKIRWMDGFEALWALIKYRFYD